MNPELASQNREGKINLQGWVDGSIEQVFRKSIEDLAPAVKKGPLIERLIGWWSGLPKEKQLTFYVGQDPAVHIMEIVKPLYVEFCGVYQDSLFSAAILAFSRLTPLERERHVLEVLGKEGPMQNSVVPSSEKVLATAQRLQREAQDLHERDESGRKSRSQ